MTKIGEYKVPYTVIKEFRIPRPYNQKGRGFNFTKQTPILIGVSVL